MEKIISGLKINYQLSGEGMDLLLLHGWGASSAVMAQMQERFSAIARVTNLDLPGFGHSEAPHSCLLYTSIAAGATAIVCLSQGEILAASLAAVLAASALGFLPWNFHPAKTFMGDCGSFLLGFLLGALSLMGLSKGATVISIFIPFIILGVPCFDTSFATVSYTHLL